MDGDDDCVELAFASSRGSSRASPDDGKKERQRQHVRRSYYRKLNRLQGMKDEIRQLEAQYEQVLRVKERRDRHEPAASVLGPLPGPHETVANLYRHLATLKDALRRENAHLEELVDAHARFSRTVERFQLEEGEAVQQQLDSGPVGEDVALKPLLSVDECHALVRDAYREIERFTSSHAYESSGQQVFGWRDRRQVVDDQVRFLIAKTFPGRDAEALTDRAWRLTTTPQGIQELYSSSMNMALRHLQVVDADNVVLYRTISNAAGSLRVRSLFLASRFRVGAGYILLYRSINKERLVADVNALGDSFSGDAWLDVFTWNMLERVGAGGDDCLSTCGGIVPSTAAASPDVWMLEVLLLAVRWESKVVGPMFALKA